MSRRLRDPMSADVIAAQRRASDPRGSAWVRANAGSGKTHVLTERVMRLLLSGVRPEEILCLTYTKAAAAEMRRRIAAQLAQWALLPEADLFTRLAALEAAAPTPASMARARTLFAHALETPGGLKINTIHAFCESVLHRFPLEAGVPFDFTVIEDVEAAALIRRAREAVIAEGLRGASDVAGAVECLFELLSDTSLTKAIDVALADGRKLREVLADPPAAKRRLRALVEIPEGETRVTVAGKAADGSLFPPSLHEALFASLPPDPDSSRRFVDRLWPARFEMNDGEVRFGVFLKKTGEPYSDRCISKGTPPDLAAAIGAEHDRLAALFPAYLRASLIERSEALLDLLAAIVSRYDRHKRARSMLDFDDLIERLGSLLEKGEQAWVRYKLDSGISHILLDESQDTNPEQWRVVVALCAEFFAGEGAVERPRTVFAVGDEKQSIFSFQGAEPRLSGDLGRRLARAAQAAELPFAQVPLHTSFRSLPNVLAAVDRVFAAPGLRAAVLADDAPVVHATARAEGGGTVTLWPPVREQGEENNGGAWPVEPRVQMQRAQRRVAERIAGEIGGWLEARRPLGPRDRAIRADDILILVQTRSALFTELIRALGLRGIPTPGADRLPVTAHIAVLDLMALGDVLANPADDLQLAAVLRSPLFDLSEDDLFQVAADRPRGQTLWQALEQSPVLTAREAFDRLRRWRGRLDFGRPFEFYAEVLYRDQALRSFHRRLGGEIDDVIVEFLELALAHEQAPSPSLQNFLAEMRAQEISIKRDLAEPGSGVRVMTVHGAKGLEAPVVILADAASKPAPSLLPPVYVVSDPPGPLLVHASPKEKHTPETLLLRNAVEAAGTEEYWRRLYVGMTRAEDELYLTGYLTKNGSLTGTWYAAAQEALVAESERVDDASGEAVAFVYPARPADTGPRPIGEAAALRLEPLALSPLPPPVAIPVVRPSSALPETPAGERIYDTAAESVLDAETARRVGLALHALLQHLSGLPRADHARIAEKALAVLLPEAPERHRALAEKAVAILARPEFAELFGPSSRAEVPFLLDVRRSGAPVRLAGRIDRILVAKRGVLVVDFKSDAVPARTVSEVPASYVTQVGLYAYVASQLFPGLAVEAGILWTSMESLMILPDTALRDAVSAFTMR